MLLVILNGYHKLIKILFIHLGICIFIFTYLPLKPEIELNLHPHTSKEVSHTNLISKSVIKNFVQPQVLKIHGL